jgi:hypothetical protein
MSRKHAGQASRRRKRDREQHRQVLAEAERVLRRRGKEPLPLIMDPGGPSPIVPGGRESGRTGTHNNGPAAKRNALVPVP